MESVQAPKTVAQSTVEQDRVEINADLEARTHSASPSVADFSNSYDYDSEDSYEYTDGEEDAEDAMGSSFADSEAIAAAPRDVHEDLLSFSTFPLTKLEGHHIMTARAFTTRMLIGTNEGTVLAVPLGDGGGATLKPSTAAALLLPPSSSSSPSRVMPLLKEVILHHHTNPISDLSCDAATEEYVAACDRSGMISVQSLHDSRDLWYKQVDGSVVSVDVHPLYSRMDDRPLVCGANDKVMLFTKVMLLGHRRMTIICDRYGKVLRVRWCPALGNHDLIALLTERCVCVMSYIERTPLRMLACGSKLPHPELYPPSLFWVEEEEESKGQNKSNGSQCTLFCAWGDWVQEMQVVPAAASLSTAASAIAALGGLAAPSSSVGRRTVTATAPYFTGSGPYPYRLCGLAPCGPRRYVVLACMVAQGVEGIMQGLEVRVVKCTNAGDLEDLYRGQLDLGHVHPLQLGLTFHRPSRAGRAWSGGSASGNERHERDADEEEEGTGMTEGQEYFMVSLGTVLRATPCDSDDHVAYLLKTSQYIAAHHYAVRHQPQLRRHNVRDVARQLLNFHMSRGERARVVELLPTCVAPDDFAEWERWVYLFDKEGELWRLGDIMPGRSGSYAESTTSFLNSARCSRSVSEDTKNRPLVASLSARIDEKYYDLVLVRCAEKDVLLFNRALHHFDGMFNVSIVSKVAEGKYREAQAMLVAATGALHAGAFVSEEGQSVSDYWSSDRVAAIGEAYGFLLRLQDRNDEALQVLLYVESSHELFLFIRSKKLFARALDMLPELFARSTDSTLALLLEHVPPVLPPRAGFGPGSPVGSQVYRTQTSASSSRGTPSPTPLPCDVAAGDEGAASSVSSSYAAGGAIPAADEVKESEEAEAEEVSILLSPESVVQRLHMSDRKHLWLYLAALQKGGVVNGSDSRSFGGGGGAAAAASVALGNASGNSSSSCQRNKAAFTAIAKRHARLVATLFIDYYPSGLLAFLQEMGSYLDNLGEVYALCKKSGLLEEVVFLASRMGREMEALRVLVHDMKNMPKALEFIVNVPSTEEQVSLFRQLVRLAIAENASMRLTTSGMRYFVYAPHPGETFASIAAKYDVSEEELRNANSLESPATEKEYVFHAGALPQRIHVPCNVLSSLLTAAAAGTYAEHPVVDVTYILETLPSTEPIAHAAECVSSILHCRATEVSFLDSVVDVAEADLALRYGALLRARTTAVRVAPATDTCAFCEQPCMRGGGSSGGVTVFVCGHVYHPQCVIRYLAAEGALSTNVAAIDTAEFMKNPQTFAAANTTRSVPHCRLCVRSTDSSI